MKKLNLIIGLLAISTFAFGQRNFNLYGLDHLTQSQMLNPAFVPDARFTLGLGTSQFNFNYKGIASAYEIFGADRNSTEHIDLIIGNLGPNNNQIALATSITPFNLGFKLKRSFFSLGVSTNVDVSTNLPHELLKMIWEGNAAYAGETVDISSLNVYMNAYSNVYAGLTFPVGDKLQIGTRLNYLIGHANLSTTQSSGSLYTSPEGTSIRADVDVRFNSSNVPLDSASQENIKPEDLIYGGNTGFGIDLGFVYEMNDHWSFSGSVINLGSINWNDNALQYESKGVYDFDGFDPQDDSVQITQIVDTLKEIFSPVKTTGESYSVGLSPEIFAGAKYTLNNGHEIGARLYTRFLPENTLYAFSANYKFTLGRWFYLNPSYSSINGDLANFGLGFGLRFLGLDFHLIADNLDSIYWYDARGISIQTGFQFTFKKKKKKAIQPVQFF